MKLYTVRDLTEDLKLSERTIRRYIKEGKIGHIRVGSNIRVTQEQLDKFLKGD